MADAKMKVSQMGAVLAMDDDDLINVVTYNDQSQTYVSGKATGAKVKEYMVGDNDISALGDGSVTGAILNVKSASETADSNNAETMAHNGAHQFLYNRIKSSVIVGGLTITPHDDGSFTVGAGTATSEDTIMVSGTGTSSWSQAEQKLPIGNYYASCEGAVEGVYLRLNVEENNQQKIVRGTDVSIVVSSAPSNTLAFIQVLSGTVIPAGGITIKPLIRLQSDTVKTIAPYAMTNKELTDVCIHKDLAWEITATDMSDFLNHICSKAYYDIGFVRDGDSFTGTAVWSGNNYYSFIVRREQAALYEIMAWRDAAFYTGRYIPNTSFVAFEYTGTQI